MTLRRWITIICLLISIFPGGRAVAQTPEDDPDMIEITLEDGHVQFTFSYPAEWVSAELESPFPAMQFANSEDLIERDLMGGEAPPVLQSGELWTAVFLGDQRQFPGTGELANDASITDTADFAAQQFAEVFQDIEVCGTHINKRPAALITGHFGEGFDLLILLVDMGIRQERREFGQILALSGLGDMEKQILIFLNMAASMEISDDGNARPLDKVKSAVELPECELEDFENVSDGT